MVLEAEKKKTCRANVFLDFWPRFKVCVYVKNDFILLTAHLVLAYT